MTFKINNTMLAKADQGHTKGVRTKRRKLPKVLNISNLKNEKCYNIYGLVHLHLKWLTSTTTSKTCQMTLTSNPSINCSTNSLTKNGRTSEFVDAS